MLKFPEYRLRNPDRSDSLPNYLIGHPMLSADHVPPIYHCIYPFITFIPFEMLSTFTESSNVTVICVS